MSIFAWHCHPNLHANGIQYQFDKVYSLHQLWVWSQNQAIELLLGLGAKAIEVEYSTDGGKWTALANVPEFARALGQPGYVHNTTVSFGGVSARSCGLTTGDGGRYSCVSITLFPAVFLIL